jgi:hypothetical protein
VFGLAASYLLERSDLKDDEAQKIAARDLAK